MKWCENPTIRMWMESNGISEDQPGRWVGKNRVYQDFDGGMIMRTVTLVEDPRFDIETVHTLGPTEDTMEFLKRCIIEHTEEIKRRTELLREKGLDSIRNRDPGTN